MLRAYLKAENLKNKYTVSAKLFWVVPLFSIGIAIAFSGQNARYYQMNQMNWWYTTFFPMLLILATAFSVQREKKVKNRVMSALSINMRKIWIAKVLRIIVSMICAVGIVFLAQEGISRFFVAGAPREISTLAGAGAAVLWICLSAWQIPLWLFVNEKLGFAAGIILGLAANVGLGILGALSGWWILNPFSYICRVMCPVLGILPRNWISYQVRIFNQPKTSKYY